MPALKHYHIYQRSKLNKKTYRCADPDCTHFARKELILGKSAQCPECHEKYILTHYHLDLANPKCDRCRAKPKGVNVDVFKDLFDNPQQEIPKLQSKPEDKDENL